ncbi:hypothetical protein [Streptomyces sp. 3N207]|uniref:hypothetical protein n=1 Tax=Streptomyces sp. 3N207 TaxID=3457417 RepID=UPI003FD06BAD
MLPSAWGRPSASRKRGHSLSPRWKLNVHDAVERLGLSLVEITPAATADEILVPAAESDEIPADAMGAHWALPGDLEYIWPHIGLSADAPREVKEVKLRELMATPAWASAPAGLHREADDFLSSN